MKHLWLFLLLLLVGCPTGNGSDDDDDDDSTPPGDDDDTGDDDDSTPQFTDPCDAEDISSSVGGSMTGNTSADDDTLLASCSAGQIADAVYVIPDAAPGTWVISTDNAGTDFDTVLFAFTDCTDPAGSELACNDDAYEGTYSSIVQIEVTATTDLYIGVEGYDNVGNYELTIEQVVCGDGAVGGNEQCDGEPDCDSECQWVCVDDAREDDDVPAEANAIGAKGGTFEDSVLCPADESSDADLAGLALDFYSIEVTDADAFVEATLAPGGTLATDCAELSGAFVAISDDEYNVVAQSQTAAGECPAIAAVPGIGVWIVVVYRNDPTVAPFDYDLTVATGVAECGDGTREGTEECDDDNTDPGDGCSAACRTEDANCTVVSDITGSLGGAATTGDTSTGTDEHTPSCSGSTAPDAVYEVTFNTETIVGVSTDNAGTAFDTVLYVRETSCFDPGLEIACNDDVDGFAGNYNSALGFRAEEGATYYIFVDGYDAESGAFELTLTEADCGDGTPELGEDCDDGNDEDGDGCQADCTITPLCEMEKDDTLGTLVAGTPVDWNGDLATNDDNLPDLPCSGPGGGDRLLAFEVTAAGTLTVDVDHTGGDVQYGLWETAPSCSMLQCYDAYPAEAGTLTQAVAPGWYLLALDQYDETTGGTTSVTITVN